MNKEGIILIVDDDSRNIFALSAILRARGFQTTAASNMTEAFALLETNPAIRVVLMDMMMPEMDGYEATAALKADKRYNHLPIIAVTAQAMAGDREKCIAAGATDYLSKPVDIDQLVHILNHCQDE